MNQDLKRSKDGHVRHGSAGDLTPQIGVSKAKSPAAPVCKNCGNLTFVHSHFCYEFAEP